MASFLLKVCDRVIVNIRFQHSEAKSNEIPSVRSQNYSFSIIFENHDSTFLYRWVPLIELGIIRISEIDTKSTLPKSTYCTRYLVWA